MRALILLQQMKSNTLARLKTNKSMYIPQGLLEILASPTGIGNKTKNHFTLTSTHLSPRLMT